MVEVFSSWTFLLATAAGIGLGLLNRRKADAVNTMVSVGSDLTLGIAGIYLDVIGEEHVWSNRPAVFLFNHQSSIDPLLLIEQVYTRPTREIGP